MKKTLFLGAGIAALCTGMAAAQDLKFPVGEGAFNWDSYKAYDEATNLEGQTLTIFGPWRGEDQVLVESMLAYFEAASGVDVSYSSSEGYEQQLIIDAQAGSPPDVAVLPQPGLIGELAKGGFVQPLSAETNAWLTENYGAGASWARWAPMRARRDPGAVRLPLQGRREVAGLVQPRQLCRCGLRSAHHDGRADRAERADRRRWRHAVVHRPGVGRRDRLAGDRLGRGHHAALRSRPMSMTSG